MIYTFAPIFKPTIWGGNRIAALKGVCITAENVGESWEVSALPGLESMVSRGSDAGMTLQRLIKRDGESFLGANAVRRYGLEFPLLFKFIDANSDLSVQVHPDDNLARELHNQGGKTEMWYILDSADDACISVGFNRPMDKETLLRALDTNKITECLDFIPVRKGDAFFLPAGRVHSICSGTLLAEIQQSSDLTYRLYDYGRRDSKGNPRQLHIDNALRAIDFEAPSEKHIDYKPVANGLTPLAHCRYFNTDICTADGPMDMDLSTTDSFVVVMVTEGSARVSEGEDSIRVHRGQSFLLPASTKMLHIEPQQPTSLLVTYIPA